MDKMLVDTGGNVVVTNDGATILDEMDVEHPGAEMIVEVAETQEAEIGDGTTTAAVLAGQLLVEAQELLDEDVAPTTIVEGYQAAADLALSAIDDHLIDVDVDDDLLATVAAASMTGKGTGSVNPETLAELVVGAVRQVVDDDDRVDRDAIRVEARVGESASATSKIEGVVLDKEPMVDGMPRHVEDATVVLLDVPIEVRKSSTGVEYRVTNADQLSTAMAAEERELRGYVETLVDAGVDVVISKKSIDDRLGSALLRNDVLAFQRVSGEDLGAIARATGANRLATLVDLDEADLGRVDQIRIERYGEDELAVVEGGAAARTVTLLVRGGTEHVVAELERAVDDAVDVVVATLKNGEVVPGAGAIEVAIAESVRENAATVTGRKQLAVEAFARAMDAIPRTLAGNMGMDPIDVMVDLRARHDSDEVVGVVHDGGRGVITDPVAAGVIEPATVKREAIENATEAARMLLRIDDVIAAR
jgi:thermosome